MRKISIYLIFSFVFVAFLQPFFAVNTTESYPRGIYLNCFKMPEKGDFVSFCPAKNAVSDLALERGYISRGFCPGGYGLLIKRVFAGQNDHVSFTKDGIFINGELIKNTKPFQQDYKGRPMPQITGEYVLGKNDLLLVSDYNPFSFDARYYGISNLDQIKKTIKPTIFSEK